MTAPQRALDLAAAVDGQDLAADPIRVFGSEEQRAMRDIFGRTETFEGDLIDKRFLARRAIRFKLSDGVGVREDEAGRDIVDGDVLGA